VVPVGQFARWAARWGGLARAGGPGLDGQELAGSAGRPIRDKGPDWLMPWRLPVYDGFVRGALGVPASWDHPEAYRRVAEEIFAVARTMTGDDAWIGSLEPSSPLRALDKLTWWAGGGSASPAAEVRDPWRVTRGLGLALSDRWPLPRATVITQATRRTIRRVEPRCHNRS
jgi:hypothetical protein